MASAGVAIFQGTSEKVHWRESAAGESIAQECGARLAESASRLSEWPQDSSSGAQPPQGRWIRGR